MTFVKIIIPIKQVPETSNVKMDPASGTMIREGIENIVNPLDLYAIETGILLKEKYGGVTRVVSMGPRNAEEVIREAIAMGCDDGVLLSGKAFAGSDTWATSYALSRAIRALGDFDLILCGERATDGDTGQVGPGIAAWLDIPVGTYISEIMEVRSGTIRVKRLVEDGYETLEIKMPCVITVVKEIAYPRLPTLRGKQRARKADIPVLGPEQIGADSTSVGLLGSPTRVMKIDTPKITRSGEIRSPRDPEEIELAVNGIIAYLEKIEVI